MKKLIYTVAIILASATVGLAQERKTTERTDRTNKVTVQERASRSAADLQQKLGLTDAQRREVESIRLNQFRQAEEWRQADIDARKKVMDKRLSALREQQGRLERILTPEQKQKFANMNRKQKLQLRDRKMKFKKAENKGKDQRSEEYKPRPVQKG